METHVSVVQRVCSLSAKLKKAIVLARDRSGSGVVGNDQHVGVLNRHQEFPRWQIRTIRHLELGALLSD
jgi:hypothetical protein